MRGVSRSRKPPKPTDSVAGGNTAKVESGMPEAEP